MTRLLLILYFLALPTFARDALLSWDAAPVSDEVSAYRVYQSGSTNGPFALVATVSTNSVTLTNVPDAEVWFRATAVNAGGESRPSAPVLFRALAFAPTNLTVKAVITITIP